MATDPFAMLRTRSYVMLLVFAAVLGVPIAAAAFAYANTTLRQVSLETHHAFGAIGYAEDHEAPRHFKRVHIDVVRHGGGRRAREDLAGRYLGPTPCSLAMPSARRSR